MRLPPSKIRTRPSGPIEWQQLFARTPGIMCHNRLGGIDHTHEFVDHAIRRDRRLRGC
jgi:hypothetical protein